MEKKLSRTYSIKDMPIDDRPQEKLMKLGADSLTNAELLALIIRTGTKTKTSVEISQEILNTISIGRDKNSSAISFLKNISMADLMEVKGIGESKAAMILAAITLASRINRESVFKKEKISSPAILVDYVMDEMSSLQIEEFRIVVLNTKKEIENIKCISKGIINATLVHPREVFKTAIDERAHTIILLHNHPSGDPTPSREDFELTDKLSGTGKVIGIEVIDHIIIGNKKYYSFLEHGKI
ncbi:DNA repair protein RadC [Peptoniphilus sp. oral taxon 386]|uniref:RadC family protein n=1 Tax=Peptoniphilus sp. oral taxon 386 TaxID=652713 RepID=UPI0001DA9ADF|nr:DNA repair protein RadC [Peptoniphilus sp. oral taxon 386]EFI42041.1 DNA repair protein RadC [Peptoniphilus sp. oral taxon 386 str. F0131]